MNFTLFYLEKSLGKTLVESIRATGQPHYSNLTHRPYRPKLTPQKSDADVNFLYYRGVLNNSKEELELLFNYLKDRWIAYFYDKFNNLSIEDVEDAFQKSINTLFTNKEPIRTGHSIEQLFQKIMHNHLIDTHRYKTRYKKALTTMQQDHSPSLFDEPNTDEPTDLANTILGVDLTKEEKTVLIMSAEGLGVRKIAEKLNMHAVTAWRILNRAIDKVREKHGLAPRGLGKEKKKQ